MLLTGEYAVVDGAEALVLPLRYRQRLTISPHPSDNRLLYWRASDPNGVWINAAIEIPADPGIPIQSNMPETAHLINYLNICRKLNPGFLSEAVMHTADSYLEFNRQWGWGSSSTLIHNLAAWADVNPFVIHREAHPQASGYDIAAAQSIQPFIYQLIDQQPKTEPVSVEWPFKSSLLFVYLGQKKSSDQEILAYRSKQAPAEPDIRMVNTLTREMIQCNNLNDFMRLIREHELLIARMTQLKPLASSRFSQFKGVVKSLGAWGGDFVLAASAEPLSYMKNYFTSQHLNTFFTWDEIAAVPSLEPTDKTIL